MAFVFHWPLSVLTAMELDELLGWHRLAAERMEIMLKCAAVR
ncbi:GpE family phage tail protein [Sphingopyxis yananensis]